MSDNSAAGIFLGGANILFSASEDMGGGWAASTKLNLDLDGGRDAKAYHGDRNLTLAGPMASLTYANTRTGGTQGAAFVAPVNLWNDFWGAGAAILGRQPVDVLVLAFPVNKEIILSAKYIEGNCNTAVGNSATTSVPAATTAAANYSDAEKAYVAAAAACTAADGSTQPGSTSYVGSLKYATGPLVVMVDAVSTNPTDQSRANSAAAGVASPRTQSYNATANYDAGFAKFGLGYDSPRRGKAEGTDQGAMLASFAVPLGSTSVGLNYGLRDGQSIIQLGAAYSLSKRTTMNLSWGQYTNKPSTVTATLGAAVAPLVESALSLSHSF